VENVEDELNDDWLAAGWWRHGRIHHWNQFLIQVIHAVVRKSCSTAADLVTNLQQPEFTHHDPTPDLTHISQHSLIMTPHLT